MWFLASFFRHSGLVLGIIFSVSAIFVASGAFRVVFGPLGMPLGLFGGVLGRFLEVFSCSGEVFEPAFLGTTGT